jgi:hypothetical protein
MGTIPQTSKTPRLPKVGEFVRGQGTLVKMMDAAPLPPPPPPDYVFEEITAHCELRMGKEVLKELEECWDFYGKGKSVEDRVQYAKDYAAKHNLGPESQIHIVAIQTTAQVRKQPKRDQENHYDKNFINFEAIGHGWQSGLPNAVDSVVWSSKTPDAKP